VAVGVEPEHGHATQFDPLLTARLGIDDGLAIFAALTQPESASGAAEAAVATGQIGFKPRGVLAQARRDGIVDHRQHEPEQDGNDEGGRDELPSRDSRRTCDHKLQAA
jgi:hypothetical protein